MFKTTHTVKCDYSGDEEVVQNQSVNSYLMDGL